MIRPLSLATAIAVVLAQTPTSHARLPQVASVAAEARQVYIVSFIEPAAPMFRGFDASESNRPKLGAVDIELTGRRRYDAEAPESRAYLEYLRQLREQRLTAAAALLGRRLQPKFVYEHAMNGMAVEMTAREAGVLVQLPGVRAVRPDFVRYLQTDRGPLWINADDLWSGAAGVSSRGEGQVVGVIDTGINRTHPSFAGTSPVDGFVHANPRGAFIGHCATPAGSGKCNNKLIGIYDFIDGGADGTTNEVGDVNGHGSHVAGTAVGNPVDTTFQGSSIRITGVAPRANLVSYRACGTAGDTSELSCTGSALIASINRAVADNVDVINYSIGSGPSDPWVAVGGGSQ